MSQHLLSQIARFDRSRTKLYASFEPRIKSPFAPAARMNLRFHDEFGCIQFGRNFLGFLRRPRGRASWRSYVEALKKLFRLIFVDIHVKGCSPNEAAKGMRAKA